MRLSDRECWELLLTARRGVLGTVHPDRGVDAVPVVFALLSGALVLPVDAVKGKRHHELQRVANVRRDARCVLLVDHYDEDWSQLWWVRVHADAAVLDADGLAAAASALAERYPAYRRAGAVVGGLRLAPRSLRGWRADPPHPARG